MSPSAVHAAALAAFERGDLDESLRALSGLLDAEHLNDLAVVTAAAGDPDAARTLLQAALVLDPELEDARANLDSLVSPVGEWRSSTTLGGDIAGECERAFPGMANHRTMAEHATRYSFALGLVGDLDVLDLGCGTGYGSEMLTWSARSVRGFDRWEPKPEERPTWPGGATLTYGHDLCADPLPRADVAVMYEVIEHLHDAPAALRIALGAVDGLIASFPNPVHHGSWMNVYHVNDWTLPEFEQHLDDAADGNLHVSHFHQAVGSPFLVEGRDPDASFWVVVARRTR